MPAFFPQAPKNNSATTNPGASNDTTQGYSPGSSWFNSSTGFLWVCYSATAAAAVWELVGAARHPGYVVNNWYTPWAATVGAGAAPGTGSARFIPWVPAFTFTISALGGLIATVGTTNSQFAIYASTAPGTLARPTGTALASTGNIVNTALGAVNAAVSIRVIAGKTYWLGVNQGDATCIYATALQTTSEMPFAAGSATQANLVATAGASVLGNLSTPLPFGTWGDLTAASWTENSNNASCLVMFKVGSIP